MKQPAVLGGPPTFAAGELPFNRPAPLALDAIRRPLEEALTTGLLTKGKYLAAYEEKLARHLGVKHAVAVSSCTTGLILTYQSLGVKGDVLVPSFTFVATCQALLWNDLKPVFVDIDPETILIDPQDVAAKITSQTVAIVAVHTFGNPAPIDELAKIAAKHKLSLIFDAAHGFGCQYQGQPVGRHGLAEVFSTSPTKLLVTGEGGVVATNDDKTADWIRVGREYGNPGDYDCPFAGLNARLSEPAAILGLANLERLAEERRRRAELSVTYEQKLAGTPGLALPKINPQGQSSYKDYALIIEEKEFGLSRDGLAKALAAENIPTKFYYDPPVHRQKAYREIFSRQPALPVTDLMAKKILSLPIFSMMTEQQIEKVTAAIKTCRQEARTIKPRVSG